MTPHFVRLDNFSRQITGNGKMYMNRLLATPNAPVPYVTGVLMLWQLFRPSVSNQFPPGRGTHRANCVTARPM